MEIGVNNYLKKVSSSLIIKSSSLTGLNIERSLHSLTGNLHNHFSSDINYLKVFGSYSRDTILPREIDKNSDIDILIGFNTESEKLRPESYRERLKKFALKFYPQSRITKDHPSIVVELNHINFDLVPSIYDKGFFYSSIEIPDKDGGWMETNPDDFNKKLTQANTSYNSIVKPIVRMLKAWNANQDYPYNSFDLESSIVEMNFSSDSFSSGFFYAIDNLPTFSLPITSSKKVDTLRHNADWIKTYLSREDLEKAKEVVRRIIPCQVIQ